MQPLARTAVWLVPFGLLVMAIIAVPLHILDDAGLPRYRALKSELADIQQENDKLQREVRALSRQVRALRHDPHTLERIARDELGMLRDEELIFQFAD
jgi:cell division protein FtsB